MTDSCDARIADHFESRQRSLALLADEPEGSTKDLMEYIAHAREAFGYSPSPGVDRALQVGHLKGDVLQQIADEAAEDTIDERQQARNDFPLSVSTRVVIRVDLSTGGPADYLTADLDPVDRSVSDVRYHFADWGDHADMPVPSTSPLYSMIEDYAQIVSIT